MTLREIPIPKSRDLVSHNPGISGLKNGFGIPGLQIAIPNSEFTEVTTTALLIYKTYIRPYLEYCVQGMVTSLEERYRLFGKGAEGNNKNGSWILSLALRGQIKALGTDLFGVTKDQR